MGQSLSPLFQWLLAMRLTQFSIALLFALSPVLAPISALAGFEFVAPGDKPAAPTAATAQMPQVANDTVTAEPLALSPAMPVATDMAGSDPKAIPLTPIVKESDALLISDEPLTPSPTPSMMKRAVPARPAPVMTANDSSDVQGFGRQVPLVMALQQIVPPNYRYSFGPGVAPGQRINWNGGKPWKDVVADVARNNDLNVEIVSNVVGLRRRNAMDIITAQSNTSEDDNAVQGIQLKQVTPAPMAAAPAPLMPSPWANETAIAEPMPLLQKQEVKPTAPEAKIADIQWSEEEPIAEMHEETTMVEPVVAEATPEPKKSFFDRLFDNREEQKNTKPATDKKIAVLSDSKVKSDAIVEDLPNATPDLKADLSKARAEADADMKLKPKDTSKNKEILIANEETVVASAAPATVPVKKMDMDSPTLTAQQEWQGEKGKTLRQTLTAWAAQAGASIVWSSEYDYPLQTDVRIQGSYPDAVRTMLAGFARAKPRPLGRLYSNKSVGAKPVLVVETDRLTR